MSKTSISQMIAQENMCSQVKFKKMRVPRNIGTSSELKAFIAALNNTASLEGHKSWKTLTPHKVDGNGLSLGLFNQSLGSGTLQPLIINAHKNLGKDFYKIFSERRGEKLLKVSRVSIYKLSRRPAGKNYPHLNKSISWAKREIYDSTGQLNKGWKEDLQRLAMHPAYMKLQLAEAAKFHTRTLKYMKQMNLKTYRAYLLVFDFVVQNGSLYPSNIKAVNSYKCSFFSKGSCETNKLKLLVKERLKKVSSKWKTSVLKRKMAIVNGQAYLQGRQRDISKEYCVALDKKVL